MLLTPRSAHCAAPRAISGHASAPRSRPPTPLRPGEGTPPANSSLAFHFRNAPVRLVSCNTLLSGCRLSRPPSSCLHEPNPFTPRVFRRLRRSRGSIRLALTAYQSMPTSPPGRPPSRFEAACRPKAHSRRIVDVRRSCPTETAFLREISEGTSNYHARLVFRPYAQVTQAICGSALLRTSTAVSSGFVLPTRRSRAIG